MSILTNIDGVPLFTTISEARNWASTNRCSGYHTHSYQGQTGYMGCADHSQASTMPLSPSTPSTGNRYSRNVNTSVGRTINRTTSRTVNRTVNRNVNRNVSRSSGTGGGGGTSGGGGGGGY